MIQALGQFTVVCTLLSIDAIIMTSWLQTLARYFKTGGSLGPLIRRNLQSLTDRHFLLPREHIHVFVDQLNELCVAYQDSLLFVRVDLA